MPSPLLLRGQTPFESPGRGFNLLNNYTAVEGVYPAATIRVPLRAMQADSKRANAKTYACPSRDFRFLHSHGGLCRLRA